MPPAYATCALRRCPLESLGLLLYRKLDAAPPPGPVVLPVPELGAPAPHVQQWINAYAAQLLACAASPSRVGAAAPSPDSKVA